MTTRSCPDWPELMEVAPELQFKHYAVLDAHLPADALMRVGGSLAEMEICCDLERNVFHAGHTHPEVASALRGSYWYELREWAAGPRRPT